MASSWGLSWLTAFGVSWGDNGGEPPVELDPVVVTKAGGIDVGARRFGFAAAKKNKGREEEELIFLMSF